MRAAIGIDNGDRPTVPRYAPNKPARFQGRHKPMDAGFGMEAKALHHVGVGWAVLVRADKGLDEFQTFALRFCETNHGATLATGATAHGGTSNTLPSTNTMILGAEVSNFHSRTSGCEDNPAVCPTWVERGERAVT